MDFSKQQTAINTLQDRVETVSTSLNVNELVCKESQDYRENTVVVRILKLTSLPIELPSYRTALAAGLDLPAAIEVALCIEPFERKLLPTGFAIALPSGFEAQVRPRSGLALSKGLTILNTPGTIDADYRGEIKVLLINLGQEKVMIQPGERIAQLVIAKCAHAQLQQVIELETTERGTKGYGSTGQL